MTATIQINDTLNKIPTVCRYPEESLRRIFSPKSADIYNFFIDSIFPPQNTPIFNDDQT